MQPSTNGDPKRAAIYARISRDKKGAGLGVGRQERDCRELADRLGWTIAEGVGWTVQDAPKGGKPRENGVFDDNDISAYSGKPRPGYRALLETVKAGRVDGVLVWHTDRLHRSVVELEGYIDAVEPGSVPTQTVKAGMLDLVTASGRMVARILGATARYEVDHMIERAKAKKRELAENGHYRGGPRPFGYEPDGMTLREPEAGAVRDAYAKLLAGVSLYRIAGDLDAAGIRTSTGKRWEATLVRKVLQRPRNAGYVEHDGQVIGPATWEPITDDQTWRAACALLANPARRKGPGPTPLHLLSGLARCGVCGQPLRVTGWRRSTKRYVDGTSKAVASPPAYMCSQRTAGQHAGHVSRVASRVDRHVEAKILARLSRPDAVDLLGEPGVDLAALEIRRVSLRARLDQLATAFSADEIDGPALTAGSKPLRAQLKEVDRQIGDAHRDSPLHGVADAPDPVAAWIDLGEQPGGLARQRAIVDAMVTVTVVPQRKGPQGGPKRKRSESYFDPDAVRVEPKLH